MQINTKILLLFFILITTNNLSVYADSLNSFGYGFGAFYETQSHSISNHSLPEVKYLNPANLTGNSSIVSTSLLISYMPIDKSNLLLSTGLSMASLNGSATEGILINLDSNAIKGEFDHILKSHYSSIFVNLDFLYEIAGTFGAGMSFGFNYIYDNSYDYKQVLITPTDRGYFTDTGTRTRNIQTGEMTSMNQSNLNGGIFIYYEMPLDVEFKKVAIPRLGINYNLFGINGSSEWNYTGIILGVSILFR